MRYIAFTNNHEGKERREAPGGIWQAGMVHTCIHASTYTAVPYRWIDSSIDR